MSEPRTIPTTKDVATLHRNMPGCGLAAYTALLLTIMTLGGTMMVMSGLTIVSSSEAARPTRLMYGGDVEPYLLNGLRAAELVPVGAVPDAFHAEDWTGMVVCALTSDTVLRLGPEGAFSLPIAQVSAVEDLPDGVRVVGPWTLGPKGIDGRPQTGVPPTEVTCAFEPADGGDRFAKMLRGAVKGGN